MFSTRFFCGTAALAFALVAGTTRAEEHLADTLRTETELWRLEKTWNDAQLQGDVDALDHLWDDEFVVIVPKMKMFNKSEILAVLRSGRIKFLRYETTGLSTKIFGDTAIVTGHLMRTRKINDRELPDEYRFTKVYIRRAGEWKVVLWQTSDWSDG